MNKGIVMEITDKSIVVMRPDGKFERLSRKKRNCEIGEEITYADSGMNWRSPSVAGRSAIAAAVIFCLVLFASFNGKLGSPEVIAYVSMDINPSIEMGIDIKENVLELRGLNEDGNELIQNVHYKGETLENVASRLLDKAEQKSLARGEAEIVIASTVVQENGKVSDTGLAAKMRDQVTKHIEKTHPSQASSYQVAAFAAPQEVRQAAVQNGVSMGKYTVYLNAKNSGSDVTLDELKKESVLQISKEKPEVAKSIQRDSLPSKADIKKLVEEEKSGQLDKKVEEKKKESGNGKGSQTTGSQPGKNGQTGQNGQNNQNNKNGQTGQPNQNGQQNGKTDPKTSGSTNGSSVPGKGTDKKDNDKNDDKKDDRKDNKQPPATTKPGTTNPSNPQTKPGATGPGTVRPGDKPDEQDKKKEDDRKREEAKKSEDQRRKEESDRRLEEQKKKSEEQKKEQDKKEQDKKEQEKEQDKKDDRKPDDSKKKDDGKDDDKSKGGDGKKQ